MKNADDTERRERDKQERVCASLREREMAVKQSLSVSLRERDRERESHQKEEAVQHFKALMADMVCFSCSHSERFNVINTKCCDSCFVFEDVGLLKIICLYFHGIVVLATHSFNAKNIAHKNSLTIDYLFDCYFAYLL